MTTLADFLRLLFAEGRMLYRERPVPVPADRAAAVAVLERAFVEVGRDVAGPPIPFDAPAALTAAELVRQAGWFLVYRLEHAQELRRLLGMPGRPANPAEHLSADVTLRYLPQVHRRARALAPDDVLTGLLADVLRRWPLSGVLSDVEEGPESPPDLGGHPGLMLLYAERLAGRERRAWAPEGRAFDYVEWVLRGLGRDRSPLLTLHPAATPGAEPEPGGADGV